MLMALENNMFFLDHSKKIAHHWPKQKEHWPKLSLLTETEKRKIWKEWVNISADLINMLQSKLLQLWQESTKRVNISVAMHMYNKLLH
jgi:hypothetical protein